MAVLASRRIEPIDSSRLLVCFTLPMLVLIMGEALLSRAYANWAVAAYPSGIILTVAYMWERNFRRWLKFSVGLSIVTAIVLCGWELAVAYGYLNWPQPTRPSWQDFGALIQHQQTTTPSARYLVDDRELWSKTLYYGRIPKDDLFVWDPNNTVDWIDNPANLTIPADKNFIFITHSADLPASILKSFRQHRRIDDVLVTQRLQGYQTHVFIYFLRR